MRSRYIVWLLALGLAALPLMAYGETSNAAADPAPSASVAKSDAPVSQSEMQEMKAMLKAQAEQLEKQRLLMEQGQEKVRALSERLGITDIALPSPTVSPSLVRTSATLNVANGEKSGDTASPLFFRIGHARFTPGGFIDMGAAFRSTNSGAQVATGFSAIPYNNTIQGHLTEFRMQSITSRLSLRVDAQKGENKLLGYFETDFTGNNAANLFVTANSNTLRMRMALVDVTRHKWEFTGGQMWSMLTPARQGLGLMPASLFITQVADAQYHVGLFWARQTAFRLAYHPTDNWVLGLSVENPDQFVGAGAMNFPFAFNAALGSQFDANNQTTTPNLHPDIIAKIAHDQKFAGNHNWHFEVAGVARSFRSTVVPVGGTTFVHDTVTGGAFSAGTIVEAFKNFNLIAYGYWGDGGGRYINGAAASIPDVVVRPIQTGATTFDVTLSAVHSGSFIGGYEWQATKNTGLFGYYGGYYAQRNSFPDVTSPLVIKPIIGFGGINSPNSANRAYQEGTLGFIETFFKDPNYGALQLITQGSYITRSPWFVAAGAPKNAHAVMGFVTMRYVLP